jgi:acetyl-CoA carboxylase biotin carboxyl carrier protein
MAENAPDPSEPLDVRKIHYLVRLMKRYDLTDLNLSDGKVQIRLKRRGPEAAPPPLNMAGAQLVVPVGQQAYREAPPAAAGPVPGPSPAAPEPPSASKTIVIESPMVGTYYASSAPDASPFVSVGSIVQPDTTLCIIEAMKVFTDIPAGVSGTIAEILVKNGQPVEFGQPLFRVIPA